MGNNMIPHAIMIGENIHISYTIVTNLLKKIKMKKIHY